MQRRGTSELETMESKSTVQPFCSVSSSSTYSRLACRVFGRATTGDHGHAYARVPRAAELAGSARPEGTFSTQFRNLHSDHVGEVGAPPEEGMGPLVAYR